MCDSHTTQNAFVTGMSEAANRTVNEKGSVVMSTTNSSLLDLFAKLIRGVTYENLDSYVKAVLDDATRLDDPSVIVDLFLICFHKRNCRGGEGERLITYQMMLRLFEAYPNTVVSLLELLPGFGCYRDFFSIWKMVCNLCSDDNTRYHTYKPLVDGIVNLLKDQYKKDIAAEKEISLLGKWLPREGKEFDRGCYWYYLAPNGSLVRVNAVRYLAATFFERPLADTRNVKSFTKWVSQYRKSVSALTKKLEIPEVYMCAKNYQALTFERIASKAMRNYTRAFLNEKRKGACPAQYDESGNRFPYDADRVAARKKLREFILQGKLDKLKGAQLDPHEIMTKLVQSPSSLEKEVLRAQWKLKKEDVLKQCQALMAEMAGEDVPSTGVGRLLPMIDVSGSMTGTYGYGSYAGTRQGSGVEPIQVALALGIMCSELASDPFKDMAISFTENPHIFHFKKGATPDSKYAQVTREEVGYSTQFGKAMDLLLDVCKRNKVPSEDIPNLIVFSDMQFDQQNKGGLRYGSSAPVWTTQHQHLMKKWAEAGYDRVPTIIYWNLRANTPGFEVTASHPGVMMLQGYSPSLLKFVLFGQKMSEDAEDETVTVETADGQVVMKTSKVTPWDTLRTALDQACYQVVRDLLSASDEKMLEDYKTEAPREDDGFELVEGEDV